MFLITRARESKRRHALRQTIESLENRVLLAYTLDPSFSGDGISEVAGTRIFAVQPDNKVVALVPDTTTPKIARISTDGSLDTSFGSGGQVTLPFSPLEIAFSNGKILVGSSDGLQIARYNLNGTLDTTFGGGDGIAQAPTQFGAVANDMAVAADGKIVLVGSEREIVDISQPSEDRSYDVSVRFKADGTLDNSWGGDGVIEELVPDIHNGGLFNTGIQSDGKVILVSMSSFSPMDGATWRLGRRNADGTVDSTFQVQGWDNGNIPSDLEIQSDDQILLIRDLELNRYPANGGPGAPIGLIGLGFANVRGEEPLPNGNVLVAGIDKDGSFVARLLPDGEADTTFGPDGKVYFTQFQPHDVQLDSLGRVIAGGFNPLPQGNVAAVARLANITQPPFKGSPFNVGDTIQAEDFDSGGEGIAYHDNDATNNGGAYRPTEGVDIENTSDTGGGFDVGWTMPGEWIEYTINIPTGGLYDIQTRIASPKAGGSFHYSLDDNSIFGDRQTIPNTGSFQNWTTITSHLPALSAGTHTLRLNMDFVSSGGGMANFNWLKLVPANTGGGGTGSGLTAQYFNNSDFTAPVFTRNDANINFNWGTGSPDPRIDPDTFSVRWTGKITAPTTGRYTFYTTTDDGVRLWVNNQLLIDKMVPQAATEWSGSIDLVAGQKYDIRMDYFERAGGSQAKLSWSGPGIAKQIVPASAFSGGGSSGDTQAPSMVGSFSSSRVTQNEVDVQWTPATDNVGVAGYELRLNSGGAVVVGPDVRTFAFKNLQPSTSYLFSINAFDAAGNRGLPTKITATTPPASSSGNGLRGEYFNNMDFTAPVLTRTDDLINFNWGTGSPDPRIDPDTFSVRWTGKITAPTTGRYTFYTTTDDGVRLTVNGQRLIDKLVPQAATEWSGSIDLVAGQKYDLAMEYFDRAGGAQAKLSWSGPGIAKQIVPSSAFGSTGGTTDTEPPTAVSNFQARRIGSNEIDLLWGGARDNVGVEGYELRIGDSAPIILSPGTLSYTAGGLQPNTPYRFAITAFDAAGNRGPTSTINVTTSATDTQSPSAVPNFRPIRVTDQDIELAWDAATDNTGVVRYEIFPDNQTDPLRVLASWPRTWTFGNYDGGSTHTYTIRAVDADGNVGPSTTITVTTKGGTIGTGNGLKGEYFNNPDFTNPALTRTDASVNFDWGTGSPASGIDADTFSVRWTGWVQPINTGFYQFHTITDDGVRLWVNDKLIIDQFIPQSATEHSGSIGLVGGQKYAIRMDYFERSGGAKAQLLWTAPGTGKQVIPQSQLYSGLPADTAPPTTVPYLAAKRITSQGIDIVWEHATDNMAVTGYVLQLDDGPKTTVDELQRYWSWGTLQPNTSHVVKVTAFDAAGNFGPVKTLPFTTASA